MELRIFRIEKLWRAHICILSFIVSVQTLFCCSQFLMFCNTDWSSHHPPQDIFSRLLSLSLINQQSRREWSWAASSPSGSDQGQAGRKSKGPHRQEKVPVEPLPAGIGPTIGKDSGFQRKFEGPSEDLKYISLSALSIPWRNLKERWLWRWVLFPSLLISIFQVSEVVQFYWTSSALPSYSNIQTGWNGIVGLPTGISRNSKTKTAFWFFSYIFDGWAKYNQLSLWETDWLFKITVNCFIW